MDEYSLAVFEDGRTEVIPKSWVQDFLTKNEPSSSSNDNDSESEMPTQQTFSRQQTEDAGILPKEALGDIKRSVQEIAKGVISNKEAISKLQKSVNRLICIASGESNTEGSISNSSLIENRIALNRLQKSVDRLICVATGEPEPDINLSEPAETLSDFLQIEDHIKIKHNYDQMVSYLSKIGGKTVESATRKIWRRICSTQLASKICWTGANGKYCLKNLMINNVVRDAVLVTHPDGKESEIQRATMLWFSHAQDRLRARKTTPAIIGIKNAF